MKGVLTVWSQPRGFGFIQPDATTEITDRLFVHITNFGDKTNVKLGARIEFQIGDPISIGKKPQAINAKVLPEIVAPEPAITPEGVAALAAPKVGGTE